MNPWEYVRLRHAASDALKGSALFRRASRRLLADFVERVGIWHLDETPRSLEQDFVLLVVLEGTVRVGPAGSFDDDAVSLERGLYLRDHARFDDLPRGTPRVAAEPATTAELFVVRPRDWRLLAASWTLAGSLDPTGLPDELRGPLQEVLARRNPTEVVWVTKSERLDAPVEALLQLVAGAMTRRHGEPVAAVALGAQPWIVESVRGELRDARPIDETEIRAILDGTRAPRLRHAYFAHPEAPLERPAGFTDARFDRVVYFTEDAPTRVPAPLQALLVEGALRGPEDPTFSSFLPIVLTGSGRPAPRATDPDARESVLESFGRSISPVLSLLSRRRHFHTRALDDSLRSAPTEPAAPSRLRRDQLRLPIDPEHLRRTWDTWRARFDAAGGWPGSFLLDLLRDLLERVIDELTRALSNRRVGIALSGGGACAYRIGPLLSLLDDPVDHPELQVPVDVFAGVSGGALVGAYYCAQDLPGVQLLVDQSAFIATFLPLAIVSTRFIQDKVDADLGWERVEDLTRQFLPLTTELRHADPPAAAVVDRGTLGEAVRASGAMPLGFAPTEMYGQRYADGAAAAMLPGRVLVDEGGADVTLACNCVPGPMHSNPWWDSTLGRFFYRWTPWGRVVDTWAWSAYMTQRTSRFLGEGSDVFLEFDAARIPFRECLEWGRAPEIVARARAEMPLLQAKALELRQAWEALGP